MQLLFQWCHCVYNLRNITKLFVSDKEYFIENCMNVSCLNICRSKASEKTFTYYIENAKLWCCCSAVVVLLIQMYHKIKNYLWWGKEPSVSFQNVKKICWVFFLRSYMVATYSFTKNNTSLHLLFHGLQ